ncbi:MAG TPA: Rieske 2Fe-2S domain-containing protein, partial [Anaerolineae bacterium]|nr:Rieske 2Fe-2S domain-containing protein [Anaerolineae bacterium]
MTQQRICAENDLRVGEKKTFGVGDMTMILYRLADGFYATQRLCTHTFAPLDRGKVVDGDTIQCPLHRAQFDIRTGEVKRWANFPPGIQMLNVARGEKALRTFAVTV